MPCQSSVRVDFNDRIENVFLISFFSTNWIDYTTNLRNTVGSIYLELHQLYQQSRRCICASFMRNVFIVIKSMHTIATRSNNCRCMMTDFSNRYIQTPLSSSLRGPFFSLKPDKRPRREGIDRNARTSHSRSFARVQFKRGGSGAREGSPGATRCGNIHIGRLSRLHQRCHTTCSHHVSQPKRFVMMKELFKHFDAVPLRMHFHVDCVPFKQHVVIDKATSSARKGNANNHLTHT